MVAEEHTAHHAVSRTTPTPGQSLTIVVLALGLGFLATPVTSAVSVVIAGWGN